MRTSLTRRMGPVFGAYLALLASVPLTGVAQPSQKSEAELIQNALSAAPPQTMSDARVVMLASDGSVETIKDGTSAFTCMPDDPLTPGNDPMCADEQGWKWLLSWVKKESRPANDQPGIIYMLQGGSDLSATDPWQRKTAQFIESPPHLMITWPFDPAKTRLSTTPQKNGSWIMWANTPYAHLMVNVSP